MKLAVLALSSIMLFSGCTWVKPTPGGERVRVASAQVEVAACRKLGETSVSLVDKVGFFRRNPDKVEGELTVLGRNSAAEMGGNTIMPISTIKQGERSFAVYDCPGR